MHGCILIGPKRSLWSNMAAIISWHVAVYPADCTACQITKQLCDLKGAEYADDDVVSAADSPRFAKDSGFMG